MFRLHFAFDQIVQSMCLMEKFKRFASSSGELIKIWQLYYTSEEKIEKSKSFVPELRSCTVEKTYNVKTQVLSMVCPNNFSHILCAGCKDSVLKYIDISKGKMVTINTKHGDNLGDMLLIEKTRINERDLDFFHKNLNFIFVGSRKMGLYNGYGSALNQPVAASKLFFQQI